MAVDFEKVERLEKELHWWLSQAADHCLRKKHAATREAMRLAQGALDQMDAEITMDKMAGRG